MRKPTNFQAQSWQGSGKLFKNFQSPVTKPRFLFQESPQFLLPGLILKKLNFSHPRQTPKRLVSLAKIFLMKLKLSRCKLLPQFMEHVLEEDVNLSSRVITELQLMTARQKLDCPKFNWA